MSNFWQGRKALVTGGAGFIGSNLVEQLVQLGAQVRVVDNLERGRLAYLEGYLDAIEFWPQDLRDQQVCSQACRGMEVVFHLASKVGGINYYLSRPAEVLAQNMLIDTFMWQAAQAQEVARYLYASSAHVYPIELQQSPDAPLIREEDAIPAHPELSYGWAKLMGEKLIEYGIAEGSQVRVAIVRLIGVYGKHQDLDLETGSAIPVFIRRAIEYPQRQPFIVLGTGRETRSYCHVADVLDALLLSVEKLDEQALIGPLNIGNEERITIQQLAETIIRVSGKDIQIVNDPSWPTVVWGQALDCSRAREMLDGWQPRIGLEEGLGALYAHVQKQLAEITSATLCGYDPGSQENK